MKKRITCLLAALALALGTGTAAYAEDFTGSPDWAVTFDGKKMESNFKSSELAEEIYQIQPGDTMAVQIQIQNAGEKDTDWYMTNEILRSLEDSQSVASGGAYAYILTYTDRKGTETVLYTSEAVGGEGEAGGKEGLYQATDSLGEYFFLDSLANGESGTVRLTVGLDGETQGNAYQDTLAQLQMNFAVEEKASTAMRRRGEHSDDGDGALGTDGSPQGTSQNRQVGDPLEGGSAAGRRLPQTGDETDILPYCAAALASGLILFAAGLVLLKRNQETEERKKGVRA